MRTIILLIMVTVSCYCDTATDLQKFTDHGIIPDVLSVAPKSVLQVSFPSGVSANLGDLLTPTQVKDAPQVKWEAEKGAFYTLAMVDPDAPTRADPKYREFQHWLVMNIPEDSVEKGDEVIEYAGAGPPQDSGLHRYIFLVYKQPNGKIDYKLPHTDKRTFENRPMTFISKFAKEYSMGDPLSGNFFLAEYDEYTEVIRKQLNY